MDVMKSNDLKILICCSTGMSSSLLVKSIRMAAAELHLSVKVGAIDVGRVEEYIHKVDYVLVAPQVEFEYPKIKAIGNKYKVVTRLINSNDYAQLNGMNLLLRMLNKQDNIQEEIKMDRISVSLEKYLLPFASKLGSNKVLKVIRDAMSTTVALLIIGSISILLTNFPHEGIANFLAPSNNFFNTIYAFTSGMMGLITTIAMAYYASIEYGTVPITSIMTSVTAFLITQSTIVEGWPELSVDGLGVTGLMTGIIVTFISVKTIELFQNRDLGVKMPDGVPPAIAESFLSLVPSIIVLGLFALLTSMGVNVNNYIAILLSPLSSMLNTMPGYIIYHMLCGLVFFLGINSAVVIGVFQVFLTSNSIANETAFAAGEAVKYVATNSVDTMIWAGGTGATIGLVFLMAFRSKSKFMKTLGKISLGPGIFNINEPVIFGVPMAFNPVFLIPFVFTPGILAGITYFLMTSGIISMPVIGNVPWTIPPVFVGYAMSRGDTPTTIWSGLIVVISLVIYYPFFKIADKQMYLQEQEESNNGK